MNTPQVKPDIQPFSLSKRLILLVLGISVIAALLLLPAGRVDWLRGWLYVGIMGINFAANMIYLQRVNPGLIERRSRIGPGTKRWDKIWEGVFGPVFVIVYLVAALDARFGWSVMDWWTWWLGLGLFAPATVLFTWSMGVNPFFEKTVRIQTEYGHRVIEDGPYRYVRHPGYVGFLGWMISAPLLLGSWWAFLPAGLSMVSVLIRTALEDRTLREELEGYPEYSQRTRYRLLPGAW